MKKCVFYVIICSLIILVVICINAFIGAKNISEERIKILGPESSYSFESSGGNQIIIIKKDGAIITGEAQTDTYVLIEEGVSSIRIDNLNQGQWKIHIESANAENVSSPLNIMYSGTNHICMIESFGRLFMENLDSDSNLTITSGVNLVEDLILDGGTV